VPLYSTPTLHYRARCDRCGASSSTFCAELGMGGGAGRANAIERLLGGGWVHRVPSGEPAETRAYVELHGAGEWYCDACARDLARCAG
jgi:hypothetical protein